MPTFRNQMQLKCKLIFTERAILNWEFWVPSIWAITLYWKVLFVGQIFGYNCVNE